MLGLVSVVEADFGQVVTAAKRVVNNSLDGLMEEKDLPL